MKKLFIMVLKIDEGIHRLSELKKVSRKFIFYSFIVGVIQDLAWNSSGNNVKKLQDNKYFSVS
jgi:hypothetical protein